MTKRIVLEGVWGSLLERFTLEFVKRESFKFDTIKVGIGASPFDGLRSWVFALSENMHNWRDSFGISLHQRCVWASYYYAKAIVESDEISQAEIKLFKDMTESLSELHELPDLIMYFHSIPKYAQKRLENEKSVCAEIGEDNLKNVSKSLIEWLDLMTSNGVTVIEIPPIMVDDDEHFEKWYNFAAKQLLTYLENMSDNQD